MGSHQPSSASATASTRRRKQRPHPASAVSRLSLSRTERYSQFTADSSSCVSKDEFPIFAHTGDVEITIQGAIVADGVPTVSNTYLLHQDTLARYSGFFAASTSSQWSKAQSHPTSGNERARDICDDGDGGGGDKDDGGSAQNAFGSTRPKRQWKFELDHAPVYLDAPMLVQTDPFPAQQEESGQAGDSHEDGPPATLNGSQRFYNAHPDMRDMVLRGDKILLRNYDNLFRIFYNCRPMLDNADAFSAFIECDVMLRLADQYDALAAVRPCVEHHLLQFQSRLWRQIARCSRRFLEFGYLARSKVIFKEALIHQVGLWYLCIPERLNADVPDFVLDIAEDKVYELQEKVSRVEGQLFRLSLTTEKGERVRPADDYLDWLVVSLFRQWLADKTKPRIWPACNNNDSESDNSHHSNEDNVLIPPINIYYVYGKLGSESPSAFLDHNDCEAFLALNPRLHTPENLVRFEKRMADLKALARDLVRPLLHNSLELDVSSSDLSETTMDKPFYFTCTTIEDDDIPWPLDLYIPLE